MKRTLIGIMLAVASLFLIAPAAQATGSPYPYEVCATWQTHSTSDLYPQTLLSHDCSYTPAAACEAYGIQIDHYWIRDDADKTLYEGMTTLVVAGDDSSLEPHDYSVTTVAADASLCASPSPSPTPTESSPPSPSPSATPPASAPSTPPTDTLAHTGFDVPWWTWAITVGVILLGAVLWITARKRRA